MTALILQHVEIERPYSIASALTAAGIPLEIRHLWEGALVPDDPSSYQAIVVMGGPMSAYSDDNFATRQAELALLDMA
ncbi:MAG: type 1 glutamine amidotransferase, partial [Mycobacteriales bacterium]